MDKNKDLELNEEQELIPIEQMPMHHKVVSFLYLLGRYATLAVMDDRRHLQTMIPDLVQLFGEIVTRILEVYDDPRMEEYAADKNFWINQVTRVTQALESEDIFKQADVLYFETKACIEEFVDIAEGKGITI